MSNSETSAAEPTSVDALIVGGGAAGLSAAIVLARFGHAVTVLDSGTPRNAPAAGMHAYLGLDGNSPLELLARGRSELQSFGGIVHASTARAARATSESIEVETTDGNRWLTRHLILATGIVDQLPDLPGLADHWGRGVVHCPYCHGWEVRDQEIVLIATRMAAAHQASMFGHLARRLTIIQQTPDVLGQAAERLAALGHRIVDTPALRILGNDHVEGVQVTDGIIPAEAVAVSGFMAARKDLLPDLGLSTEKIELGDEALGTRLPVDQFGQTAHPRIWAAGNLTDPMAQVIAAAAAGNKTGAAVNMALIAEAEAATLEARA